MKSKRKETRPKQRSDTRARFEAFLESPAILKAQFEEQTELSLTPTRVGPYLLLERLGKGGMAEVYLGRKEGERGFEKEVALKCVLPQFSNNESIRTALEFEAKLGSRLSHNNIAQIYDFSQFNGSYWLVMEHVRGKHLGKILSAVLDRKETVSTAMAVFIICEVLKAIEYAHNWVDERTGKTQPIIHRDLAPKNIMISYQGEVKVVDFGIAKAIETNRSETFLGSVKGTPGYMSPEQLRGDSVEPNTDLYSLSIVLYEILTLKPLLSSAPDVSGEKYPSHIRRRLKHPQIPEPIQKILELGLAKDRELRWQTAADMRAALEKHYRNSSDFSSHSLAKYMKRWFSSEIERERQLFDRREAKIKEWKANHLLPALNLPVASWKRSKTILFLLLLTVMTTGLNLYLQLFPNSSLSWQMAELRKPSSIGTCSFKVESDPPQARVIANAVVVGNTPVAFRVRCGEKVNLSVEKMGFSSSSIDTVAEDPQQRLLLKLNK